MKILQVVTLVTPDGAYGGPVRVALNQARALRDRGHDVTVAAATRGYDVPPTELDGVPLHLFPARTVLPGAGYAGVSAPSMLRWFIRHSSEFDAVHVHLARDLVTLPIAALARAQRRSLVVQTHGMIDPTDKALAKPLDAVFTRPTLRSARSVFHLTDQEKSDLLAVAGDRITLRQLTNGVPDASIAEHATGAVPEVLYLARLQARKRPTVFVDAARALLGSGVQARFTLVGPDEGEGDAVRAAIGESAVVWEGALDPGATLDRMRSASVYVLPSVNEPYPMSVLEAMSVGVPVVVTDTCGLAPLVADSGSGIVVDDSTDAVVNAIRTLIDDPVFRSEMGSRAYETVRKSLGMTAVCEVLEDTYSAALGTGSSR